MRPRTIRIAVGVAVLVYVTTILVALAYAWVFVDAPLIASLFHVTVLGGLAALFGIGYFLYREVHAGDATTDNEFTWAVAIVLLFLHGVAPGLIATGLYGVVEREFSARWMLGSLVAALVVTLVLAGAVSVQFAVVLPLSPP